MWVALPLGPAGIAISEDESTLARSSSLPFLMNNAPSLILKSLAYSRPTQLPTYFPSVLRRDGRRRKIFDVNSWLLRARAVG